MKLDFFQSCRLHARHEHRNRHGHGGHHDDAHHAHHVMKRLLAHGDLRFVVLLLIEEKPRHGYELIKLIESKSSNQYSPSPGVIYPTLTYLEETGLVKTKVHQDKKQYSITPEGAKHLEENREISSGILKRLKEMGAQLASAKAEASTDSFAEGERAEIKQAFHAIKTELKGSPAETLKKNKKQILAILKRTLTDIQALTDHDNDA